MIDDVYFLWYRHPMTDKPAGLSLNSCRQKKTDKKRHCGKRCAKFQAVSRGQAAARQFACGELSRTCRKTFRTTCMYSRFAPCRVVFRTYRDGLSNIREFLYLGGVSKAVIGTVSLSENAESQVRLGGTVSYRYQQVLPL